MSEERSPSSGERVGLVSALSIGIGGMVGGGIFAVTGLTVELTRGAAPVAFVAAGVVALLTSYSYWRLTLRFPSEGGTVAYLNRGFGPGQLTGALNVLLPMCYVVLLAVYAYAFGSYGATLVPGLDTAATTKIAASALLVGLATLNVFGARLVLRSENAFNVAKLSLLAVFIVVGLASPMEWGRLGADDYAPPVEIFAGAMVIFLNYEGFELISNAGPNIDDPKRTLPIAFVGGVAIAMVLYVSIVTVVVGHLSFAQVAANSDSALSAAADEFMGSAGVIVAIAALIATSSAINATFYGAGRLTYEIARSGELPAELERNVRGRPVEGMLVFAVLALVIVNTLPLNAIATMGSAGFLIVFGAVNVANARLATQTSSRRFVSTLGAGACGSALAALCWQVWRVESTRSHLWVLAGMVAASWSVEWLYRRHSGRQINVS